MVHWLRALSVLLENKFQVPALTSMHLLTTPVTPAPGESGSLLPSADTYTHVLHSLTHTHK